MSSKAIGQQQQGRRTPLSLTGGKNNQHQQQSSNNSTKAHQNSNNNSSKNQESKDSATTKNNNQAAKHQEIKDSPINKNNNQASKSQQEQRDSNPTQRDTKKTQQNGNNDNSVEQNGPANGTSNGVVNKNSEKTAKVANQNANRDNNQKDKDKEITETAKEKPDQKPKRNDVAKATEKKQNDLSEKQTVNTNKSKDVSSTPTPSPTITEKINAETDTPAKTNTSSNAHRKSSTPSKTEKSTTSPSTKSSTSKTSTTPSKSPKTNEKSSDVIEEANENDIEPLMVESSPPKKASTRHTLAPTATSTPGKIIGGSNRGTNAKSEVQLTMESTRSSVDRKSVPRTFSDISGRRSIRSSDEYTPSMYNTKFRESYRRINTELDVTSNTNTSMNVTVGSEIPNNSSFLSFSLFGRGRKRERTPPATMPERSQSAVELTMETTPPKRARLDVHGIFSVMASPLTMLRTRFSKATLETPVKGKQTTIADDVQNVSGVSIEEVAVSNAEITATEDITVGQDVVCEKTPSKTTPLKEKIDGDEENLQDSGDAKKMDVDAEDDIKITETPIVPALGEPKVKQRGCLIM